MSFLDRFFGTARTQGPGSAGDAKQRLKVLLVHDQVDLSPAQMERMKAEIMEVIARYAEVDPDKVVLRLEKADDHVSVVSSVAVRRVTQRVVTAS